MRVEALGARLEIDLRGIDDVDRVGIERVWERCRVRGRVVDATLRATLIGSEQAAGADVLAADVAGLAEQLTVAVTLRALELQRRGLLMLHAAGLADPATGRAVALVAPSGTGKTTAARTLARSFGYLSDETVAIDARRRVRPYPKPISVIETPGEPKRQLAPDDLGLLPAPADPRLVAIVVLERDPAAVEPELTELSLAEGLGRLVPQLSYLPELRDGLRRLVETVDACGGVHLVRYAEAETLREPIAHLLRDAAPVAGDWLASDARPLRPAPRPGLIARAPAARALVDGDTAIVLREREVRVLEGVAPALWMAAAGWTTREELTDHLVREFGAPPDAGPRVVVDTIVDELLLAGVLQESFEQEAP